MFSRLCLSAALACIVGTSAFAADPSSNAANPSTGGASQQTTQTTQNLPKEIRSKLEQDGFTNVQIVPGSFLVSAKDKNGDPVTMVLGPNSMMMLTEVPNKSGSTTGSGSTGKVDSSGTSSTSK